MLQSWVSVMLSACLPVAVLQASIADDDSKGAGKSAVAAGGFTILSEKKLFLGQKVCRLCIAQITDVAISLLQH